MRARARKLIFSNLIRFNSLTQYFEGKHVNFFQLFNADCLANLRRWRALCSDGRCWVNANMCCTLLFC